MVGKDDIKVMRKQMVDTLLRVFIVISVAGLILLVPLYIISFTEGYYINGFERYDVYKNSGYSKEIVDKEFISLLDYVEGKGDTLSGDFFNEKEKEHFRDVREIFKFIRLEIGIYLMLLLASVSYLVYKKEKNKAILGIRFGAMLSAGIIILLGIISSINFKWLFIKMHEIIFSNNLWLMNYNTDVIIRLMPQGLFFELAVISFGISLIISILLVFLPQLRNIYKNLTVNEGK
jgi:integral membrane protein (TIGR01906 family)